VNPHARLVEHLTTDVLDAGDRAHAASCPACAALLPGEPWPPRPEDRPRAELLAGARRELQRRRRPSWLWPVALAAGNAALALAAVVYLEPWNWVASASPHWVFVAVALLLAVLATLGISWASAPPPNGARRVLLLALLAPVAILLGSDGHVAHEHFLEGTECLWTTLLLGAAPLAAGAWLLTRTARSGVRSLCMGLAAAGVGLLVLQFHCADGHRAHLFVFHLLPWAALAGLLVLVRRWLPSWSYAP
jgi:hypothetical protein